MRPSDKVYFAVSTIMALGILLHVGVNLGQMYRPVLLMQNKSQACSPIIKGWRGWRMSQNVEDCRRNQC